MIHDKRRVNDNSSNYNGLCRKIGKPSAIESHSLSGPLANLERRLRVAARQLPLMSPEDRAILLPYIKQDMAKWERRKPSVSDRPLIDKGAVSHAGCIKPQRGA